MLQHMSQYISQMNWHTILLVVLMIVALRHFIQFAVRLKNGDSGVSTLLDLGLMLIVFVAVGRLVSARVFDPHSGFVFGVTVSVLSAGVVLAVIGQMYDAFGSFGRNVRGRFKGFHGIKPASPQTASD